MSGGWKYSLGGQACDQRCRLRAFLMRSAVYRFLKAAEQRSLACHPARSLALAAYSPVLRTRFRSTLASLPIGSMNGDDGGGRQEIKLEAVSGGITGVYACSLACPCQFGGLQHIAVTTPLQNHELRIEVDWGKQVHLQVRCPTCSAKHARSGKAPQQCNNQCRDRAPSCPCLVQLVEGQAEVFGTALDLGERVSIAGQKVAVYSWQGCTLALAGEPDVL
jgi:hypothetical protein